MKPSWSSSNSPVRGRRGRLTAQQSRALTDVAHYVLPNTPLDIDEIWGSSRPLIVDIGFGHGESTVDLATKYPGHAIIAIDVHPPGIARLLRALEMNSIANVRIIMGNAVDVLDGALAEHRLTKIVTLFPDPWPKARHHKRRLIQPASLAQVASHTDPGATWHLATDWAPYAAHIEECFAADSQWSGGRIERPDRTETKYERRGRSAGRSIAEFAFTRVEPSVPSEGKRPPGSP